MEVDASYEHLRCALRQQQEDEEYLPVGYCSQGLSLAERNYRATEKKLRHLEWYCQ